MSHRLSAFPKAPDPDKRAFYFGVMTEIEFYESLKDLLKRLDAIPGNTSELRRQMGILVSAERDRRINEDTFGGNGCFMHETDILKIKAIKKFNALNCRMEIESGKFTKSVKNVRPFVCDSCWEKYDVDGIISRQTQKEQARVKERDEYARQREIQSHNEVVEFINTKGKSGKATASQAYWMFRNSLTEADFETLAAMPYKSFLDSNYWFVLRRFVLYQAQYKCSLCSKSSALQVHHKHYKNRGREILTWKTDLIALCSNCHAKQHDKLPSYE